MSPKRSNNKNRGRRQNGNKWKAKPPSIGGPRIEKDDSHLFNDIQRAKRTLVVEGFHPKRTTSNLLWELFVQGGPIEAVIVRHDHAFVRFQDEISVAFCLALFSDLELFGTPIRIRPKYCKDQKVWRYKKTLSQIHEHLSDTFRDLPPPYLFEKKIDGKDSTGKKKKRKNKIKNSNG